MRKRSLLLLAMVAMLALSSCSLLDQVKGLVGQSGGSVSDTSSSEYTYLDYKPGDKVTTYFFDFVLEDAREVDAAQLGYTLSSDENKLIAVEIYVKNIHDDAIEMYYDDFWLYSSSMDEDGWAIPYENLPDQFQDEYPLEPTESTQAKLYFEVPAKLSKFELTTIDFFENYDTENVYSVLFTV